MHEDLICDANNAQRRHSTCALCLGRQLEVEGALARNDGEATSWPLGRSLVEHSRAAAGDGKSSRNKIELTQHTVD